MATTTIRLGLILILSLTIIQISKAKSETEDQNEIDQESEASMMVSSSEEAKIRNVREAGKNGNKLDRKEKNAQKKKKKKKGEKASRKAGQRKNKVGRRQRKKGGKAGKGGKKPRNGADRKRPRKGKKRNNNKRKSEKELKKKKKKRRQNKNGKRQKKITKKFRKPKKPTGIARQGTCDEAKLCQKIKDYIKYSNQLRKVRRIVKSCDTMDKKATKAATEFSATVAALDQVISGNAKRQLYIRWRRTKRSTDEVVAIRDNLKNCSASAKAKCEKSVEPACAESAIHTECDAALEAWLKSFGPSKGSCLQASADCCACITALPEVDAKCLDFEAKSKAAVASKKKCTGGTETGSFGFCRKQQQDASVKGPKAACGGSTATKAPGASTTKAGTGASTAAQGLKAVALIGGVYNQDNSPAGVSVVGEEASSCTLSNLPQNITYPASTIFKDHILVCGGEVNSEISSSCWKMSTASGSSRAWKAGPSLMQPLKHTAMAVLKDNLMLIGGQTKAIRGQPLTKDEFEEGDRSSTEPMVFSEMKCGGEQTHRITSNQQDLRWPNAVVPYEISGTFDAEERKIIAEGLKNIMDNTCVVWRAKISSDTDWVNIVNEQDGCFADLGYLGPNYGAHVLNVKGFGCVIKSTVIHEAGHNLGLQHEHNRPDRDNYWTVNWLNVKVALAFSYWKAAWATEDIDSLKKCSSEGLTEPTDFSDCIAPWNTNVVTDFSVGYDFESIMHYTPVVTDPEFVVDGSVPIMSLKDSSVCNTECLENVGFGNDLSSKDIEKIKKAYSCSTATATTSEPSSATTPQPSSDSPVSSQIWLLSSLDENTATWTKGGDLSTARYGHCAITVSDKVFVTGGSSGGSTVLKSTEQVTLTESQAAPDMNQARMYHGCTVVEGSIIVAGGIGALNGKGLDSVEKFSSGQWETLASLPAGRYSFPMLTINSKAFIFGGTSGSGAATDSILMLNQQSWDVYCDKSKLECKGIDRRGHTAASLTNIC